MLLYKSLSSVTFWSVTLPINHFVCRAARGTGRSTQFNYCAVTTDIQLTIDDKPLILLIAQLTQILNNRQFSF